MRRCGSSTGLSNLVMPFALHATPAVVLNLHVIYVSPTNIFLTLDWFTNWGTTATKTVYVTALYL